MNIDGANNMRAGGAAVPGDVEYQSMEISALGRRAVGFMD